MSEIHYDKSALIAMSGGVDSSVAAYLMLQDGYRLEGTTMRLYHWDKKYRKKTRTCCTDMDFSDASEVAVRLGIPYEVTDYEETFRREVIEKFIRVYENGGTPNPCIDCNRVLKFEKLLEYANDKGLSNIVTGHYSRIELDPQSGRFLLKKAVDNSKDQSYVLYNLTQEQLAHTVFPLGNLTKDEVRRIAAEQGFVNAAKRDSQDICFIPDGDYAAFIERYTGWEFPDGDYLDTQGNVIGRHHGAIRYTIGQRKGLGVAFGRPQFVCAKSMEDNTVTLSDEEAVFHDTLIVSEVNWIAIPELNKPVRVTAKHRYRAREAACTVYPGDYVMRADNDQEHMPRIPDAARCTGTADDIYVVFDEPQRAMTPGQALVMYDGDVVLGGGTITAVY